MKKITLSIIALVLASLVFVLSGCEMSLNLKGKDDTQSHTVIVEVTDDSGVVIATEAVTLSEEEIKKGETFFDSDKDDEDTTIKTGVSSDRLQQAVSNNKNKAETTLSSGDSDGKEQGKESGKVQDENTGSKPGNNSGNEQDKNTGNKPADNSGNEQAEEPGKDNGAQSDNSGSADNSVDSELPDDLDDVPYVQDDAAILKSTQYILTGRAVYEGVATPYKVARSGEKLAMFSEIDGQQIGVIVTEDLVYMLNIDEKTYIEITKEMLKENMTEEELANFTGSALDVDKKVKQTMNQSEDGVVYDVVVYEDGTRDYFIGSTIMKTVATDGSVLYYDSVSAVVPASVFAPPADYKRTTLDEEGVSEFMGVVETTADHSHSHDE